MASRDSQQEVQEFGFAGVDGSYLNDLALKLLSDPLKSLVYMRTTVV